MNAVHAPPRARVTPVKTGVQNAGSPLDTDFHRYDSVKQCGPAHNTDPGITKRETL